MSVVYHSPEQTLNPAEQPDGLRPELLHLLKRYWGYESFLPMQDEAIAAILNREDSLVILPTGGGKSLCYQLPALVLPGTAVVVSPLVSLMKDQVDTLNSLGIPAGFLNSSLDDRARTETLDKLQSGFYRLFYVAPERFAMEDFVETLQQCQISSFVIDEAHCISAWGHDFRPAYRELNRLRGLFPGVGIHAFTATATPPVRDDIVRALNLNSPKAMTGDFDRPNLLYRVQYRSNTMKQLCEVIDRYPNEGGIIYCISRKDVDGLAEALRSKGYNALPYHAGLSDEQRQRNQDAFMNESVNIVVATVAFGMGIDRSNIRYVIHTGMPKSIESYQQEAGRAGRDRLDAECVLLYSGVDVIKWKTIMGEPASEYDKLSLKKLFEMSDYCQKMICRHRFLVEYFGQAFAKDGCGRCDYCLGEYEVLDEANVMALKILSCVARVKESFGVNHVAQVLTGANTDRIRQFGHEQLSTYGLLGDYSPKDVTLWIEQLIYQGYLTRESANTFQNMPILKLTQPGMQLLKGSDQKVSLAKPVKRPEKKGKQLKTGNFNGNQYDPSGRHSRMNEANVNFDANLFEALRKLRRAIALEKKVPPYVVFSDVTLKEMAARKPTSLEAFRSIKGVGESKLEEFCPRFLQVVMDFENAS